MQLKSWVAGALALLSLAVQGAEEVQYQLTVTNATQHLAEVKAHFPASENSEVMVQLPNWRTGKYQILPLANGLRRVQAISADGKALPIEKIDKSSWKIQTSAGQGFSVHYELYANELGSRTRHISDSHAYLDASAVFVYNPAMRPLPISITLNVPEGWQSRSGMDKGDCEHCFVARDYDQLISSPIETGIHQFFSTKVDGRDIELLIWGEGNYDSAQMLKDLASIAKTTNAMFDSLPYQQRYLFIVHATDGEGGATEHLNSTVIQRPRWNFAPRKEYLKFIRTAAHEYFHTWNVKAYRPAGLVPYDYHQENYSKLLWVAEGNTSYFDNLLTLQAGVQTEKEYLEELNGSLTRYFDTPGRFEQTAAESSFDEWIQPNGDRHQNASVSIYTKGEMLGLVMDLMLRQASNGKRGLADVHKALYRAHRIEQGGYNSSDLLQILQALSDEDWQAFWRDYVEGVKELPLLELLQAAGIERVAEKKSDDNNAFYWWGLEVESGSEKEFAKIKSVLKDSPAWKAGLTSSDIVVAIDSVKVDAKTFAARAQDAKDKAVTVQFFRHDRLRSTTLTAEPKASEKFKLQVIEKASRKQQRLRSAWLSQ